MESAGARLKKLRLEKGLSLEEAHKKTKVHLNILKSIEEDSFVNLSPVYIRGFLKIYCQFLGVDPREYMPDYQETQVKINLSEAKQGARTSLRTLPLKLNFLKPYLKPKIISTALLILALILLSVGLFKLGKFTYRKSNSLPKKVKVAKVIPENKRVQAAKYRVPQAIAVTPKTQYPASISERTTASIIRLAIHAKEDSWAQIKIDGKTVFQSVIKKAGRRAGRPKIKSSLVWVMPEA